MSEPASPSGDEMLRESARRLFQDHVTAAVLVAVERGEWPGALWQAIGAAGLPAALLPEAAGGYGVAIADALGLLREAGRVGLPVPLAETMLAGWLLAGAGLAVPEGPLALVAGPALKLQAGGAGWRLSGVASGVAWGRAAAAAVALVVAQDRTYVAVLRPPDWTLEPAANTAGEPRDRLRLHASLPSVAVAAAAPGIGLLQLRAAGAVTRSLMIAGALERVTEMAVQYAGQRCQFGKPIGRFQAVQQNLAVLATQAAAASAAADLGVQAFAQGLRLPAIAVAKSRAAEAAGIGAAIAHQIHGAIGFTHEHSLHFLTRRLWAWRDEYGGESEWNLLLGRHLAAGGADRLWAELTAL